VTLRQRLVPVKASFACAGSSFWGALRPVLPKTSAGQTGAGKRKVAWQASLIAAKNAGSQVNSVLAGREAASTLDLTPHLIVMDLSMPRMTGLEAAHVISKEFPRVPIFLLTLYLTHHLAAQAHALGIRATLSKTDMQYLIGEIEAILSSAEFREGVN
jgi:CheY-like chemotaxis protein